MIIESVDLKDYRNYKILNMNFNPQINIIYGDNAQGKTNILVGALCLRNIAFPQRKQRP